MNIRIRESGGENGQAVDFSLGEGETMHILHPEQILAYRGPSDGRSDRLMNVKGIYRKKRLIQADMSGPSQFTAAVPPGFAIKTVELLEYSDLLYDFRNLFFYSSGIEMHTRILKIKNMLITQDAVKMKFTGTGTIGLLTEGAVYETELHPTEPVYVDAANLVAYPENAKLELTVYGNTLASQHMNYHWKMTGTGTVLYHAGMQAGRLQKEMEQDGLLKRILREVIPFGGVIIK
ncbi:AIM24 family protein [Paenibacillus sp. KQZ6P-2]|uniref:AIM24 family protein n=1 Tax=Paenibacillus mangrovi TaxID=2931978 RepID=A0A9X1WUK8_9BACL|nr:AIM24 family protein [Paenibacillus mangrovi]MCJ8013970.1 AIM24 family protein [Paenibacillus mangrovi]